MDEDYGVFIFVMICIAVYLGTSTPDSASIHFSTVNKMILKCASNGGVEKLEHDYDVTCKDGAYYTSDGDNK